jgi:hypothetical protein
VVTIVIKAPIQSLYVNTFSLRKTLGWYRVGEDGSVSVASDEPPLYEALQTQGLTRGLSLVLFRHGRGAGVFWGPEDVLGPEDGPQGDHRTRPLQYRALAEFVDLRDATEFYGGLLRHWWPRAMSDDPSLPEFMGRVSAVVEAVNESRQLSKEERLYPVLYELLERWQKDAPEDERNNALQYDGPLLALESPERLRELESYVWHDLRSSNLVQEPQSNSVRILVVVARKVGPEELRGVWRALSGVEDTPAGWTPNDVQAVRVDARTEQNAEEEQPPPACKWNWKPFCWLSGGVGLLAAVLSHRKRSHE